MKSGNKKHLYPPQAASWLIERMFPDSGKCSILGDMIEIYRYLVGDKGLCRARLWFWGQCIKAFPSFVSGELYWRFSMLKNYLIITLRVIKRHKGFIFFNFIGLTIGLTSFLLILLFVRFEFSFDRYHKETDSIFRVIVDTHEFYRGKDQVSVTPAPLAAAIKNEFPEVEEAVKIREQGVLIRHKEQIFSETVIYADPEILDLFTFPIVSGDKKTAMKAPYSLLLTRQSAEKYFGDQDPIGQILSIDNRPYHVTGILENIRENSHFHFDFLSPFSSFVDIRGEERVVRWSWWSFYTYVKLREDADPAQFEPKLTELLRIHSADSTQTLRLQALKDIHFYGRTNFDMEPYADIRNIYLFSAIALFILLIACFNYMNLSTARASRRAKEVGMRKVVGATRKNLIRQFLAESFLFTLVTFFLSIGLVRLLFPAFGHLINRKMEFSMILQGGTSFFLLGVVVFVGLISGLYPAIVLSSFRPVTILKGDYKVSARASFFLRNSLVSLQFVISIALIFCSLVVYKQLQFIKNKEIGLVTDFTMSVYCYDDTDVIRREFESYPGILDVTACSQDPINITSANMGGWEGKSKEENLIVYQLSIDYNSFDFLGIQLLEGRNFSRERALEGKSYILNEAAVRAIGWEDPIGNRYGFEGGDLGTVIGVVKDFHFAPLNLKIEPLAISLLSGESGARFLLKVASEDISGTIAFVESTWKKIYPDRVYRYSFLDDNLDRMYRSERKLGTMFTYFTILAIVIAGLGLFGIASFTAEQKTKEIGIRKVLGASVSGISFLLTRNFLRLVIIANLVAWPLGWFIMQKWLQNFAYRTNISPIVFVSSAFMAVGIALLTVSYQAIKAALADPIKSIRNE